MKEKTLYKTQQQQIRKMIKYFKLWSASRWRNGSPYHFVEKRPLWPFFSVFTTKKKFDKKNSKKKKLQQEEIGLPLLKKWFVLVFCFATEWNFLKSNFMGIKKKKYVRRLFYVRIAQTTMLIIQKK